MKGREVRSDRTGDKSAMEPQGVTTSEPADRLMHCIDCGEEFTFTVGEQQFFAERAFSVPKRCKPCRDARRDAEREKRRRSSYA